MRKARGCARARTPTNISLVIKIHTYNADQVCNWLRGRLHKRSCRDLDPSVHKECSLIRVTLLSADDRCILLHSTAPTQPRLGLISSSENYGQKSYRPRVKYWTEQDQGQGWSPFNFWYFELQILFLYFFNPFHLRVPFRGDKIIIIIEFNCGFLIKRYKDFNKSNFSSFERYLPSPSIIYERSFVNFCLLWSSKKSCFFLFSDYFSSIFHVVRCALQGGAKVCIRRDRKL